MRTIAGACDTHMHFYGPPERYPEAASSVTRPIAAGNIPAYRALMARLGLERVVVVQPSTYGADNTCTLDAVAEFGDAARAVVVVTPETPEAEIARLHAAGARGARFFMMAGAPVGWDALPAVAAKVAPFGWHLQLQFDGHELPDREAFLRALPCDLVFDHVFRFHPPPPIEHPAVRVALRLLEGGRAWMKASGPYITSRNGPPHYEDVAAIARAAIAAAPDRVVWASNWPHPNPPNDLPDEAALLALLDGWAADPGRILSDNAAALYGWTKSSVE